MIELQGFRFGGDLFYQEEAYVPFRKGITLLRGFNHDAGPTDNNSNGAGKTRIPQLLSAFIFNDSDRGNLKRMVLPHFRGALEFANTATKEKWLWQADVAENEWEISRDGQPFVHHHKFSECQGMLARCIGGGSPVIGEGDEKRKFTRKEWSNFVHINRHSISVLLQGTPDLRRKFLESFFNIDDFYKEKLEEYKALKAAQEKAIELLEQDRARYGQVLDSLSKLEARQYLENQIEFAKECIAFLSSEFRKTSSRSIMLRAHIAAWDEYYDLSLRVEGMPSLAFLKERLQALHSELAVVREKIRVHRTAKEKAEALARYDNLVPPAAPSSEEPTSDGMLALELALMNLRAKDALREKYRTLKGQIPVVDGDRAELAERRAKLLDAQADNRRHQALVREGKNCTHCGQSIDFILQGAEPEERRRALAEEASSLAASVADIDATLRKLDLRDSVQKQIDEVLIEGKSLPTYDHTAAQVADMIATAKKSNQEWEAYRLQKTHFDAKERARDVLRAELAALEWDPSVKSHDLAAKEVALQSDISLIQQEATERQRHEDLLGKVVQMRPQTELKQDLADTVDEETSIGERLTALNEQHGEWRAQLALATDLNKTREELETRLADGQSLYDEYRVLQALVKFFSPAGFKMYELRKRCELIIERANYWSPTFFSEQHEWSLPADVSSLEFLVQPVKHRKTKPFPAGELSAGEENRAERVLLFSQLDLAPRERSLNVLFLDEIEGHLDPAGRVVFCEIVVPKLREAFPDRAIVLISHEESLRDSPYVDHLWLAERKDRKTTLKVFDQYNH